jgi:hypothetical protein
MRTWWLPLVAGVIAAAGCSKKASPAPDDPAVKVCNHVVSVCGKDANLDMCVASSRAMRKASAEAADQVDTCVLAKTTCQDISLCSAQPKTIRASRRHMNEALEKAKQRAAEQAAPSK